MACGNALSGYAKPPSNEPAAMTHDDLPFDCLAVGQKFAVDLPHELMMRLVRTYIRENPGTGFAFRREDGRTTCTRLA
jgi:hypothetical protein